MGCQMNVLDSELVMGQLHSMGYRPTDDMHAADVVLVNTCSVRDHAEAKVYSRLGALKKTKVRRPDMIVGVIGCMAERDPDGIIEKLPHVDLICGPGQLNQIPTLIGEVRHRRGKALALATNSSRKTNAAERSLIQYDSLEALDLSRSNTAPATLLQSYIRVQRGCDKFCTFCVVPFTRGPERSRSPHSLVEEARMLADRGCKEITLLGQTVNSYAHMEHKHCVRFCELLYRMNDVQGIERIRFVTSYPGDFGDDILEAMRDLPKVCEYLHIPAQSGADTVLRRMKRQYTVGQYVELISRAREYVPGLQLASDFIVGFCSETEDEYAQTVGLVEQIKYKNIFVFKYSPRPDTVADRHLPDDVPLTIKKQRNTELLKVQEHISLVQNQRMIGKTVQILVEGYSKAAIKAQQAEQDRGEEVTWELSSQLVGRTRGDQIVVFSGDSALIGQMIWVTIVAVTPLTLHALIQDRKPAVVPGTLTVLR